nr:MAG TPA: hypothetical protein [Caudoviricetes sp.]
MKIELTLSLYRQRYSKATAKMNIRFYGLRLIAV